MERQAGASEEDYVFKYAGVIKELLPKGLGAVGSLLIEKFGTIDFRDSDCGVYSFEDRVIPEGPIGKFTAQQAIPGSSCYHIKVKIGHYIGSEQF